jgi:hypothetical protein
MAFKAGTTGNFGLIQIPNGRWWNGSLIGHNSPIGTNERAKGPQRPPLWTHEDDRERTQKDLKGPRGRFKGPATVTKWANRGQVSF